MCANTSVGASACVCMYRLGMGWGRGVFALHCLHGGWREVHLKNVVWFLVSNPTPARTRWSHKLCVRTRREHKFQARQLLKHRQIGNEARNVQAMPRLKHCCYIDVNDDGNCRHTDDSHPRRARRMRHASVVHSSSCASRYRNIRTSWWKTHLARSYPARLQYCLQTSSPSKWWSSWQWQVSRFMHKTFQ